MTIRRIVLGGSTLVTCGAGVQVEHILCGFECCYIAINNLPSDTKPSEIEELFTTLGVDVAMFYVVKERLHYENPLPRIYNNRCGISFFEGGSGVLSHSSCHVVPDEFRRATPCHACP